MVNKHLYEEGDQPCEKFSPEDDLDVDSGNVHTCPRCWDTAMFGTLSFCTNCHSDHHSGGYDTCTHNPFAQEENDNG